MKNLITASLLILFCGFTAEAQTNVKFLADTSAKANEYWAAKIMDLLEPGVEIKNDSFIVREEVIRLLNDTSFSKSVYPASYDWPSALKLMQVMELKKAFWHFINLWQEKKDDRDLIISTIMVYDSILPMDKVISNSFYTYGFADPRICRIKNGKPDIFRPDLLQELLATTKEIVNNILYYRRQKEMSGKKN